MAVGELLKKTSASEGYDGKKYAGHVCFGLLMEAILCVYLICVLRASAALVLGFFGVFFVFRSCLFWGIAKFTQTVRGALFVVLLNLLPFLILSCWITLAFVQPGALSSGPSLPAAAGSNTSTPTLINTSATLGNTSTNLSQNPNTQQHQTSRTCVYELTTKQVKSFMTLAGVENNTVSYQEPEIICTTDNWLGKKIAPWILMVVPGILQIGVPLLYLALVFGAMKSMVFWTEHDFLLQDAYTFLQFAVLDFFDVCTFMTIALNVANYMYFVANPIWRIVLPAAFSITYMTAIMEACLPYHMIPCIQDGDEAPPRTTAFISLVLDLPLAVLRIAFALNGLQINPLFLVKNLVLIVTEFAILVTGDPENCLSARIAALLKSVPGFQELQGEVDAEVAKEEEEEKQGLLDEKEQLHDVLRDEQEVKKRIQERSLKDLRKKDLQGAAEKVAINFINCLPPHPRDIDKAFKFFAEDTDSMNDDQLAECVKLFTKEFSDSLEAEQKEYNLHSGDVEADQLHDTSFRTLTEKFKRTMGKVTQEYAGADKVMQKSEFADMLRETWWGDVDDESDGSDTAED